MENTIEYDKKIKTVGGYYHVIKDDKFGLADKKGNIIIPIMYDDFLIIVGDNLVTFKDGKAGVIDFNNNIVKPFVYEQIAKPSTRKRARVVFGVFAGKAHVLAKTGKIKHFFLKILDLFK